MPVTRDATGTKGPSRTPETGRALASSAPPVRRRRAPPPGVKERTPPTSTIYSSPRHPPGASSCCPEETSAPTFETLPSFTTDLQHLTPAQSRRFRRVVLDAFVPDLRTGRQFRPGLREARGFAESRWG
ncbi:hypothetical protein ACH4MO_36635 [Streptomyces globisporus]|uniref:hypothetical protein n=1 Tax=Streptomyces globisporus TaxID=1908 RepID=UPI00117DB628